MRVNERVKREFGDLLLTTGAWGTMRIEFDGTYELKRKKYPFNIVEFTPFQVVRLSLDDYGAIVKSCVWRAHAASCSTRSPSLQATPCMTSGR